MSYKYKSFKQCAVRSNKKCFDAVVLFCSTSAGYMCLVCPDLLFMSPKTPTSFQHMLSLDWPFYNNCKFSHFIGARLNYLTSKIFMFMFAP